MYTPQRLARIADLTHLIVAHLIVAPRAMVDRPAAADTVVESGVVG